MVSKGAVERCERASLIHRKTVTSKTGTVTLNSRSRGTPGMTIESQAAVTEFLTGALRGGGPVEIIRTHISAVFMAGERALKLKRAVRFPYLDFSTAERRLAACQAELQLNRRTAPNLYLGVHRITRETDGQLALDGAGRLVDAVVEMRRFAQEALFDNMARRGALTPTLVTDLARR